MAAPQPVRIVVTSDAGAWHVPQLVDFTLTLSMKEFSDSFELTLADPEGNLRGKVYNDCAVEVFFGETSVLTGSINLVNRGDKEWGHTLHVAGRSTAAEWAESDAIPKKYKKTTDNEVIRDVFAGSGFTFDLADPVSYTDWDVGLGTTKAEAASRIAEAGGFELWHSGNVISKRRVATSGAAVKTYATSDAGIDCIPILADSVDIKIDTSRVRTKLIFFGSDGKHEAVKETREVTPTLKLQSPERTLALTRIQRLSIDAKDKGEAQRVADANAFRAQPTETLSFDVRGRDDLALNTPAAITIPRHGINSTLVCYERRLRVSQDGSSRTQLSFVPFARPLP